MNDTPNRLPAPDAVEYPDSGFRKDADALAIWAAHMYDTGGEPYWSADSMHSHCAYWSEMWRAANARAEGLLSADIEYDAAESAWDALLPDGLGVIDTRSCNSDEWRRFNAAIQRRAKAITALRDTAQAVRSEASEGDNDGR